MLSGKPSGAISTMGRFAASYFHRVVTVPTLLMSVRAQRERLSNWLFGVYRFLTNAVSAGTVGDIAGPAEMVRYPRGVVTESRLPSASYTIRCGGVFGCVMLTTWLAAL